MKTIVQNTPQWVESRRKGIGGSDIGAIAGVNPHKTPLTVFLEKTGQAVSTINPIRAMIGHALEPGAAAKYEEERGRRVQVCNLQLSTDDPNDYRIGSVDRLCYCLDGSRPRTGRGLSVIRTDRALEIKSSSSKEEWEVVPRTYKAQMQHYMGLMPSVVAFDVPVVFVALGTFRIYEVLRNEDDIEALKELANDFYPRYVLTNTPPPPVDENDCKLLWARSNPGKKVYADAEIEAVCEELAAVQADLKSGKAKESELKAKVEAVMGDAEVLLAPGERKLASWKSNKDSEKTDYEAAFNALVLDLNPPAEKIGAILNAHTEVKPGARVFRLS